MHELTELDIKELKAKNFLAEDGHPSTEAFKHAILTLSDFDTLVKNVLEHGRDCSICGDRYKKANSEILELRSKCN